MTGSILPSVLDELCALDAATPQKRYVLAKVAYAAARSSTDKEIMAIAVAAPTRDEVHAICDADPDATKGLYEQHPYILERCRIEDHYDVHDKWKRLHAAENELVAWAKERCARYYGERYHAIAVAFEAWPMPNADLRTKLLDLCMRLPAEVQR